MTLKEKNRDLAEVHWNEYVYHLLNTTLKKGIYTKEDVIENCRFHYLTAWEHGSKHYAELLDGKGDNCK